MRRLYSTFPGGFPGAGLLLLRVTIGVSLMVQAYTWMIGAQSSRNGIWAPALLALVTGISFVLGLLTPLAGVVFVLASTTIQLCHSGWNPSLTSLSGVSPVIMATAITLLGPGAFSLDARFFGRRKVIVPRVTNW